MSSQLDATLIPLIPSNFSMQCIFKKKYITKGIQISCRRKNLQEGGQICTLLLTIVLTKPSAFQ